jgi:glucose/arabinose dehydrogenase
MRNLQPTLVSTTATFVLSLLGSSADAHDGAEGPSGLLPQGFYEQGVATGWDQLVGVTFDSTGRAYPWERSGKIWAVETDGTRGTEPILDISDEVGGWRDHGLLGVALHPGFRQNGWIYLLYAVDRHHLLYAGTGKYEPGVDEYYGATIGRVTRYTVRSADGFNSVDPESRLVLLGETPQTGIPIVHESHAVGSLVFGTDGTLLLSVGDCASYNGTDNGGQQPGTYVDVALNEGILKPHENVGAFRAQTVDSHCGKILRLNPNNGDGLPSNPFFDSSEPRAPRSRVWALGLRNPFRMTLKPGTGSHNAEDGNPGALYIGDVGYVTWEELNVCDGPAQNFGWPIYEGHHLEPGYAPVLTDNPSAPNPLASGCGIDFFRYQDLLVQDTLNEPYWGNPCDNGGIAGDELLENSRFNSSDFFPWQTEFNAYLDAGSVFAYNAAKLYGPFASGETRTRIWQDFPVVDGKSYAASVKAITPSWDSIFGTSNSTSMSLQFFDSEGNLVGSADQEVISGSTGEDVVVERSIYAAAPETAVTGRMVLAFDQPSFEVGAVWFDDASVLEVQQILQAEDAMWDGPSYFEGTSGGATGSGLLDFQNPTGDWIEWTVPAATDDLETIAFRYALGNSPRPLELQVNGVVIDPSLNFPSTSGWTDWQLVEVEVPFVEGDNSVRITAIGQSGANFDALIVGGASSESGGQGENPILSVPTFVHKRPMIAWLHTYFGNPRAEVPLFDTSGNATVTMVGANGSPVSGEPFGGNCAGGVSFSMGDLYPESYRGSCFIADHTTGWIRVLREDEQGNLVSVEEFRSNMGNIAGLFDNPYTDEMWHIRWPDYMTAWKYSPSGNQPPVAVANLDVEWGTSPLVVNYQASDSYDPNGGITYWEWDFGDGTTDGYPDGTHVFTASNPGQPEVFDVTLRVSDPGGLSDEKSFQVVVNDSPPSVQILQPVNLQLYRIDSQSEVPFRSVASDEQTPNDDLELTMQVILHHNDHTHPELVLETSETNIVLSPLGCGFEPFWYRVVATATDGNGLTAVDEVELFPDCDGRLDCPADVDLSGTVDFNDILNILAAYGSEGDWIPEDVNIDGIVDFADILQGLADWGICAG